VDEAAIAGGFMLDPIPMVKAKLSDIMLPADAEVILEGHIYPGEMADEGPFGWVSYYHPKVKNSVYRVELISHRKGPIIPFVAEGMMPSDTVNIYSVLHSRELMDWIEMMGCAVKNVILPVEARLVLAIAPVAIKLPGVPQRIADTIFGVSPFVRKVLVTDSDYDSEDLMTPLNDYGQKAHPLRDWHLQPKIDKPLGWTENHDWDTGLTSTFWWDASFPYGKPAEELPMRSELEFLYPRELQDEVIRKWNEVLKLTPKAWRWSL
jgi:4-hydroxy-3-polyprenylbenzoate decarboxylase